MDTSVFSFSEKAYHENWATLNTCTCTNDSTVIDHLRFCKASTSDNDNSYLLHVPF